MALFIVIVGIVFLIWLVQAAYNHPEPITKWVTLIVVAAAIAMVFIDK